MNRKQAIALEDQLLREIMESTQCTVEVVGDSGPITNDEIDFFMKTYIGTDYLSVAEKEKEMIKSILSKDT